VAKRLIGSGCRLDGRGMGVLDGNGDRRKGRGSFGVNLGRSIVTNGDFATRLFPNYFGQELIFISKTNKTSKHLRNTQIRSIIERERVGLRQIY